MREEPVVVAVINTNPDLVRLLRIALDEAGYVVFALHIEDIKVGSAEIDSFLRQHNPRVIVYDVAPPYEPNWRFLDHLRTATGFRDRQFVLTTVNRRALEKVVGLDESVFEVVGDPTEIMAVVRAVREASRARPVR